MRVKNGVIRPKTNAAEDLSSDDDLLSWILIDQLGALPNTGLGVFPQQIGFVGPKFDTELLTQLVQDTVVKGDVPTAMEKLQEFELIKSHMEAKETKEQRDRFVKHLRRYLYPLRPESRVEIHTTPRYSAKTKHIELAVYATRPLEPPLVVKELQGTVVPLPDEWRYDMSHHGEALACRAIDDELESASEAGDSDDESGPSRSTPMSNSKGKRREDKHPPADPAAPTGPQGRRRDFSIIWSSLKKCYQLFLGPARFMNHDCEPNVELHRDGHYITFRVLKPIKIGEELTTYYGADYFGAGNAECLCATCEKNGRGGFAASGSTTLLSDALNQLNTNPSESVENPYPTPKATPITQPDESVQGDVVDDASHMSDNESPRRARSKRAAAQKVRPGAYMRFPPKKPSRSRLRSERSESLDDVAASIPRCITCLSPLHERIRLGERVFEHCPRCIRHSLIFDLPWPAHRPNDVFSFPPSHLIPKGLTPQMISSVPIPSWKPQLPPPLPPPTVSNRLPAPTREEHALIRLNNFLAREELIVAQLRESAWAEEEAAAQLAEEVAAELERTRLARAAAKAAREEAKRKRDENKIKGTGVWQKYEIMTEEEFQKRQAARLVIHTSGTRRGGRFKRDEPPSSEVSTPAFTPAETHDAVDDTPVDNMETIEQLQVEDAVDLSGVARDSPGKINLEEMRRAEIIKRNMEKFEREAKVQPYRSRAERRAEKDRDVVMRYARQRRELEDEFRKRRIRKAWQSALLFTRTLAYWRAQAASSKRKTNGPTAEERRRPETSSRRSSRRHQPTRPVLAEDTDDEPVFVGFERAKSIELLNTSPFKEPPPLRQRRRQSGNNTTTSPDGAKQTGVASSSRVTVHVENPPLDIQSFLRANGILDSFPDRPLAREISANDIRSSDSNVAGPSAIHRALNGRESILIHSSSSDSLRSADSPSTVRRRGRPPGTGKHQRARAAKEAKEARQSMGAESEKAATATHQPSIPPAQPVEAPKAQQTQSQLLSANPQPAPSRISPSKFYGNGFIHSALATSSKNGHPVLGINYTTPVQNSGFGRLRQFSNGLTRSDPHPINISRGPLTSSILSSSMGVAGNRNAISAPRLNHYSALNGATNGIRTRIPTQHTSLAGGSTRSSETPRAQGSGSGTGSTMSNSLSASRLRLRSPPESDDESSEESDETAHRRLRRNISLSSIEDAGHSSISTDATSPKPVSKGESQPSPSRTDQARPFPNSSSAINIAASLSGPSNTARRLSNTKSTAQSNIGRNSREPWTVRQRVDSSSSDGSFETVDSTSGTSRDEEGNLIARIPKSTSLRDTTRHTHPFGSPMLKRKRVSDPIVDSEIKRTFFANGRMFVPSLPGSNRVTLDRPHDPLHRQY